MVVIIIRTDAVCMLVGRVAMMIVEFAGRMIPVASVGISSSRMSRCGCDNKNQTEYGGNHLFHCIFPHNMVRSCRGMRLRSSVLACSGGICELCSGGGAPEQAFSLLGEIDLAV